MTHKLGICIPYRNRRDHLEKLVESLSKHLKKQNIDHKFYVGNQIDDKLLNRGSMKNIAADYAFKDGCDYIAWHDVDMLPFDQNCDYSYPETNPIHIATKLSKYGYKIGYDQYFGGVVLFTKEQVLKTNGYSNEYWDWGSEDDDLFWRCHFEGFSNTKIFRKLENKTYGCFNGETSSMLLPLSTEATRALNKNYTISVLFYPEQQKDKIPVWLIGDENRKFVEFPILRKTGAWSWGISFNNSRTVTSVVYDKENRHIYNWGKRFENLWTWITVSYSKENKLYYFYINNELVRNQSGVKEALPTEIPLGLKQQDFNQSFILGFCQHVNLRFKGKIGELKVYNDCFTPENTNDENLVLHYDFLNGDKGMYDVISGNKGTSNDVTFETGEVNVIDNIIPHRREGSFYCLPHLDEGFLNGKWVKGETTSRNEKRLVTEMQEQKINYKEEGFNKILNLVTIESVDNDSYPNTIILNVKMK